MSDVAVAKRSAKRHWAEPGSRHDVLVRLAKFALPIGALAFLAMLAIAPFDSKGDVSFILDKKEVDRAAERMRIEEARYSGEDNRGHKFIITADRAIQQRSDLPVVDIEGMVARLGLARGPLTIAALDGRYDLDTQIVDVTGPVRAVGPDGYLLQTRDVRVDLKDRTMTSDGRVTGRTELGQFAAGRMSADLGERTVTLSEGARLKIVQGAVR